MKKLTILLAIICIILITIILYQSQTYTKIPRQYECVSDEIIKDNVLHKQIVIININKDQYVENYQNKIINTYFDKEQYKAIKDIESTEEVSYEYDDNNQVITTIYKIKNILDSENNLTNIWYKEYITNVEQSGFICEVIK